MSKCARRRRNGNDDDDDESSSSSSSTPTTEEEEHRQEMKSGIEHLNSLCVDIVAQMLRAEEDAMRGENTKEFERKYVLTVSPHHDARRKQFNQFRRKMQANVIDLRRALSAFQSSRAEVYIPLHRAQWEATGFLDHVEFEVSNFAAFLEYVEDDFFRLHEQFFEDIVVNSHHLFAQKIHLNAIVKYLQDISTTRATRYEARSRLCAFFQSKRAFLTGEFPEKYAAHLTSCRYVLMSALVTPVLDLTADQITEIQSAYRDFVRSLEEPAKSLIGRLYSSYVASKLSSFLISAKAMDFFNNGSSSSSSSWPAFVAAHEEFVNVLFAQNFHLELLEPTTPTALLAGTKSGELMFGHFRRVLTKNLFSRAQQPRPQEILLPLRDIAVCAVATHGACSLTSPAPANELDTSKIPDDLTVYYVTDVLTDTTTSWGNFRAMQRASEYMMYGLHQSPRIEGKTHISEKELIDVVVKGLKTFIQPAVDVPSKFWLDFHDETTLASARNAFLTYRSIAVKKFRPGEDFAKRLWVKDDMPGNIEFKRNILADGDDVEQFQAAGSELLFQHARESGARVLVLVDFSCKNIITERKLTPEGRAKLRKREFGRGELFHLEGGGDASSRILASVVRRKTRKRRTRRKENTNRSLRLRRPE